MTDESGADFASKYYDQLRTDTLERVDGAMVAVAFDDGGDEGLWVSEATALAAPVPSAPAPKGRAVSQRDYDEESVGYVNLDLLLKGPIDEVYRNNSPGDAEFLVAHMKASLAGLQPTIESFEEYNAKLEEENARLAEEEADLDERLRGLGIVVPPGRLLTSGGARGGGRGGGGALTGGTPRELEAMAQELLELESEIEYAQMELDDIIEMVRRDASIIGKIEARAPPEIKEFLASYAFWEDVQDRYTKLDVDRSGAIDAEELFPIILELTNSEPWAVTEEHCKKFLRIFDTDGDGLISLFEFNNLLRFCVLMTTVEGSTKEEEAEGEKTVSLAKRQVDEVIRCVEQDVGMIDKFEAQCPQAVRDFLGSDEFWVEVQTRYKELDVDRNGVVDPEELFPVIIELTNSEPWAVDDSHCRMFTHIFDEDRDGRINLNEFEKLVRFCVIMSALDEFQIPPVSGEAFDADAEPTAEPVAGLVPGLAPGAAGEAEEGKGAGAAAAGV
jgi:Ca2+-binding EF-hand superfamily protein